MRGRRLRWLIYWGICAGIMMLAAGIERGMGRLWVSASGKILLWVSGTTSAETSQQVLDIFSVTHVEHGLVLFGGLWWLMRKRAVGERLVICVLLEAGWEVLENSAWIIERYRQTAAKGYIGDSVLNSMADIGCCVVGFWLARKLPVWVSVVIFVGVELLLLAWIRDNLTLNVVMLVHPFEGVRRWQLGG